MNKQELVRRLKDIEWEDFEVKEAKSDIPKSSWQTVSAFANTAGGWIIFGVKQINKQFVIQGITNPEKIEQDFTTVLRTGKFNQKIIPVCRKYVLVKKTVLAFYIPLSNRKPIYYNTPKNTFIRTASGGHSIRIVRMVEEKDAVSVIIRKRSPERLATMAYTNPSHIVKLNKTTKDIVFVEE